MSRDGARTRNPFGAGGASGTEMGLFDRQDDQLTERLLGDPGAFYPERGHDETALFVRALPAAVAAVPDPSLEVALVPALADAARSATLEASRIATTTFATTPAVAAPRWRLRLAALAAVVAALPVLVASLAYAGVALPDPVDDAFEAVGVDLPNQADAGAASRSNNGKGRDNAGSESKNNAAGTEGAAGAASTGGAGESQGSGNHGKGKPEHAGPEGTPPGHGGTPTGQGGTPPGNAGVPPGGGSEGSAGPPPEVGPPAAPPAAPPASPPVTPPGQGGTPPGQG